MKVNRLTVNKGMTKGGGKREGGEDPFMPKGKPVPDWKNVPIEGWTDGLEKRPVEKG